jgi:hypothetical protein
MKFVKVIGWSSALCLSATLLQAQETNEVEVLRRQLKEATENFDRVVREQRQIIDALSKRLDSMQQQLSAGTNAQQQPLIATTPQTGTTNEAPAAFSAEEGEALKKQVDELTEASKQVVPSRFNPAIGFVGETIGSYTSKGPNVTGLDRPGGFDFNLRSAELTLQASVDPFIRGYGVINASADPVTGEAALDVEEAALVTTSLPWNLTARAGRFFAEFGRLAYVHEHDLPFVNRPIVLDEYLGGESRTDGVEVNYLFPTERFISLTLGTGSGFGEVPNNVGNFRSLAGLNFWGRMSTYQDLNPNLSVEGGMSGLYNDKASGRGDIPELQRRVGGLDFILRYNPLGQNVYRGFEWGSEALLSSGKFLVDPDGIPSNGDEVRQRVNSFGLYSYIAGRLSRQWTVGFLFDYAQNVQNHDEDVFRYSPYVTWKPSEFQLWRLQYSYTDQSPIAGLQSFQAVYLQWEFILGAHSHGFRQR